MKASRPIKTTLKVLTALFIAQIILTNASAVLASINVPAKEAELAASQKAALAKDYGWSVRGTWSSAELATLLRAGQELEQYIQSDTNTDGQAWIRKHIGPVTFHTQTIINQMLDAHISLPNRNIYLLNRNIVSYLGPRFVLHEIAHLLDNNLGGKLPASLFGGGPAEKMVADLGGHPERCSLKFYCPKNYTENISGPETWGRAAYANHSVSDDFADTFTFAIRDRFHTPEKRLAWMDEFIRNIQ